MKTGWKSIALLFSIPLLLWGVLPASAADAQDAQADAVGFFVRAELPENQADQDHYYFDLSMEPGQRQELAVQIVNSGQEDIVVEARTVSASTNCNGIIDYTTPDVRDETLQVPFSSISKVKRDEIVIPAGQVETALVTVKMPEQAYDGVILGGIVFTKKPSEQDVHEGMNIRNVYSYVVGVKLTETDRTVAPEFEGLEAGAVLENKHVYLRTTIRNSEAAIAKDVKMDIAVFSKDRNKAVLELDEACVDVAPNSILPYSVKWDQGTLVPGEYVSYVHMELDGREWDFELPFTLSAQDSFELKSTFSESADEMPAWMVIVLILLITLIILVVVLLATRRRKPGSTSGKTG